MQSEFDGFDEQKILPLLEQKFLSEPWKFIAKPLPFERLVAGTAFKPKARLLKLPFEILDEIFEYVPNRSLPAFALTSRDCCRLARGRQFTNVTLDYSPNSWSLAHSLLAEANLVHEAAIQRPHWPCIGPAVRQLTIRSVKEYIEEYHKTPIWEPQNISRETLKKISELYQRYIRTIQLVLANSLPNIETIIWADHLCFDDPTYQAIFDSRAQNLALNEVYADARISSQACTNVWPLRTLHLGVAEVSFPSFGSQTELLWDTIIRPSAPHLESLTWIIGHGYVKVMKSAVQGSTFPALRRLQLKGQASSHGPICGSLISPNSRLRWLGVEQTCVGTCLSQSSTISSLESLTLFPHIYTRSTEADENLLSFLESNTHLKELYLPKAFPTEFFDQNLLPLLGSQFKNLTSLFLVGAGETLDESSLELIGNIRTLELLHLSAGDQQQFSPQWIVAHESIRQHLAPLSKLKTLLFSQDVRMTASVLSSDDDDDDALSLDSDDATSSTNSGDNPNTDLDAIIAAVAHGAMLAPMHAQDAAHQPQQDQEQDDHSIDTTSSDEGNGWDFAGRRFSVTGLGNESYSLSRLLQRMRDEKVEQEAQAYFLAFEKLQLVYVGKLAFDRDYDETTGTLWRKRYWASLEALLPSMMRRI